MSENIDVMLLLTKQQQKLVKLLTEYRLVRHDEIACSRRACCRAIERLRKQFLKLGVPLVLKAIPNEGYLLMRIGDIKRTPVYPAHSGQSQPTGAP